MCFVACKLVIIIISENFQGRFRKVEQQWGSSGYIRGLTFLRFLQKQLRSPTEVLDGHTAHSVPWIQSHVNNKVLLVYLHLSVIPAFFTLQTASD